MHINPKKKYLWIKVPHSHIDEIRACVMEKYQQLGVQRVLYVTLQGEAEKYLHIKCQHFVSWSLDQGIIVQYYMGPSHTVPANNTLRHIHESNYLVATFS
jgi:hypothetical protein